MDAFHQVLYVVYHKYLPNKEFDKIRGAGEDLVAKAEAVTKATLPTRLEAKAGAFKTAAGELLDAAKALDAAGQAHDHAGMEKGVDTLHTKYQALEKIFD
jgi:molecular chaperone GrpE (heat shock protein)